MGSIELDRSSWPVVVVRFDGIASDDEFARYLEETLACLQPGKRSVTVLDAREPTGATQHQRRMQADWMKQNRARIKECSAGLAFVFESPMVRGVLTAIMWISPLPVPHRIFAKMEEAREWSRQRLAAHAAEQSATPTERASFGDPTGTTSHRAPMSASNNGEQQ